MIDEIPFDQIQCRNPRMSLLKKKLSLFMKKNIIVPKTPQTKCPKGMFSCPKNNLRWDTSKFINVEKSLLRHLNYWMDSILKVNISSHRSSQFKRKISHDSKFLPFVLTLITSINLSLNNETSMYNWEQENETINYENFHIVVQKSYYQFVLSNWALIIKYTQRPWLSNTNFEWYRIFTNYYASKIKDSRNIKLDKE